MLENQFQSSSSAALDFFFFFLSLGSYTPKAFSSLKITALLGIAFPFSYC
jgi:hypothetical protein